MTRHRAVLDVTLPRFNAKGDGIRDDGPAIQAALQAIVDNGGGVCYLPTGRYRIDTPIVITGPSGDFAHQYTTLLGDQWGGTQLVPGTAGMDMVTIQSDDPSSTSPAAGGTFTHFYRFQDLTFDSGSNHGGTGIAANTGIYLADVSHFQIIGCNFLGFQVPGEGPIKTIACAWGQMHENNFVDNEIGTICLQLQSPVIEQSTFGHFISSSLFGPRNSNCVFIGEHAEGTIISGCHFAFHASGYSIRIEGFEQTIANNYIYPHTTGTPNEGSIGTGPYRQQGVVIDGGYQVLIAGNFMENAQENPMIDISNDLGVMGGGAQISILSNTIRETGQESPEPAGLDPETGPEPGDGAITVRASAGSGIVINGNTFQSNFTDHHIKVEDIGNSKRLDISGNSFEDAPNGTVNNSKATAGEDVLLADWTNDGVRLGPFFSPYLGHVFTWMPDPGRLDTDDNATPDVRGLELLAINNASPTTITNFLNGYQGQKMATLFTNGNTTVDFSSGSLNGNGGASRAMAAGELIEWRFDGAGVWHGTIIT